MGHADQMEQWISMADYSGNDFKPELARRAVVRALRQAAAGTPQSQTNKQVA